MSTEGGIELTVIESTFAKDTLWSCSACLGWAAPIFAPPVLATGGSPALESFNEEETDSEPLRASKGKCFDPSCACVG